MRKIEYNAIIETDLTSVWNAWTTNEGVRSFFAPDSNVELKVGGPYELYFDVEAPEGHRGSEGMRVQTYIPERLLAFDWNNPPSISSIRNEKTWVVLEFQELNDELCEMTLTHLGWKDSAESEQAFEYFKKAWSLVISRFERAMHVGAIDWSCPRV